MRYNIIEFLARQSIVKFILLITACNLATDCLSLPFYFIKGNGGLNNGPGEINFIEIILFPVFIGPLVETFIEQMVPINIMKRITNRPWLIIAVSAAVFSIIHGFDDFTRLVPSFFGGVLLAFSFWHWSRASNKKAYLITCAIHSLHNLALSTLITMAYIFYG